MSVSPTLLWFRQDLRLRDNPALNAALARGGTVVPVYVLDDEAEGRWAPGGASRWWLHHSLVSLDTALREKGSRLILARGRAAEIIPALQQAVGAGAVYWNRRYEPTAIARDSALKAALGAAGIEAKSWNSALLFEPHEVRNREGGPFRVFTPFWRHCLALGVAAPGRLPAGAIPSPGRWPESRTMGELSLLPRIRWDTGLAVRWKPGEAGARERLRRFVAGPMEAYADARNAPTHAGTSALSPSLHFGELGPRQIWAAVRTSGKSRAVFPPGKGAQVFLSEVGWREFAHHLLFHFPRTPAEPLRAEFTRFPWAADPGNRMLQAWQRGSTGYPIVDAGMRELWHTGWMHNRVRMIAASFLVKHLRLPWLHGAEWFWDTLVDADLASNTLGWQWTAGCGADAAPFFRVFAPVLQGRKFDPDGTYVKRWVPELANLPAAFVHAPWAAAPATLAVAGVTLGGNYPLPVVDHATARDAALKAWRSLRTANSVG